MADEFDPQEMVARFRARAEAVRNRGLPPVEGPDRQRFIEQARTDFMDYAMLGDAEATIEDGVLVLRVDLRRCHRVLTPVRLEAARSQLAVDAFGGAATEQVRREPGRDPGLLDRHRLAVRVPHPVEVEDLLARQELEGVRDVA